MDSTRWGQIQSVFHAVADLSRDEQSSAVEALCGVDGSLAEKVMEMLGEDSQRGLLDADIGQLAESALQSDQVRSLIQRQIGPYRLLRVLGEGGMGVVYLAERTDIGGLVAIKLLRDAWMSPMRRERFVLEQQTLVKLNHPAIARIYDASTMEDGTPWFVMEFADGKPLTTYLKDRGGTVQDDLILFRRVCEAVQHAHNHAVIHRDLKPSNILVTAEGDVKLLDFGIAKQMDPDGPDLDKTISGLRFMTPAYAAPEQRAGGSIGVFTDIYALGLLMYEILTGQLAKESASGEIERPSHLIRRLGDQSDRLRLSKSEWADVDVLCLTALQSTPERRYRSVDALIGDITAFLEGRALQARPNSFFYVSEKFVRRNAPLLTSVAVALLLLAGAAILFTVRLAHARDGAIAEAARTDRMQRFTENLFTGGDAGAGPAADLKVTALLDRGQTEAASLRGDPTMQADMFEVLGGVSQKLGRLDQAEVLLQRAMDERRDALGPHDRQYAESLIAMGLLRKDQRRMADAEKLLREGLSLQNQTLRWDDPAIEHSLWALGSVLSLHGNYAEAMKLLEDAVSRNSGREPQRAQLARDWTQLGDVHFYQGNYPASEEANKRALAINEALFGARHPAVADNLNNLGHIASDLGRYDEAEDYFRSAVAVTQAWFGAEHPKVAENLTDLSAALTYEKKYDQAQSALERALTIQQHVYRYPHPSVAILYNQLGSLAYSRDQDDEAEKDFYAALAIWRTVYGEHHQFVGVGYANLGDVFMDRKDFPKAEAMFRQALGVYGSSIPEDNINPAIDHMKLGRTLLRENRPADAEPETLKGYKYLSAHVSQTDGFLRGARKDLVAIETMLGRPVEAARYRAELNAATKLAH